MKKAILVLALTFSAAAADNGAAEEAKWRQFLGGLQQALVSHGDSRTKAAALAWAFNEYKRSSNEITGELVYRQLQEQDLYLLDYLTAGVKKALEQEGHPTDRSLQDMLKHGVLAPDYLISIIVKNIDKAVKVTPK